MELLKWEEKKQQQLIYGNVVVEIERKKKWQLICGNVVAGMEGKKKKKNSANGVAENERENCLDKKNIWDSYSKKYTYSYSFHVSVVFLTETVWFMCM